MDDWNKRPRISTDYQYRGIDASVLENRHLRVMVLQGKGGDILEFRDKRTDVDVLWHADHEWSAPPNVLQGSEPSWDHHYPGGWQVNLPVAAGPLEFPGGTYEHHGETALVPWEATIVRDDETAVTLELTTTLQQYPFTITRELTLPADGARLEIHEEVTNLGEFDLEYAWQQHLTLGQPLIGPQAHLDVPAERGYVEEYDPGNDYHRLQSDTEFEWPTAPARDGGTVDLESFPPTDAQLNDMAYLLGFDEGWYAVTNPDLDLGFGIHWPADLFESLWYWQPFGGLEAAPFWGRNYTAGLEPTTTHPGHTYPEAQRENGSMKTLAPGETVEASFVATTFGGQDRVDRVGSDGTVETR